MRPFLLSQRLLGVGALVSAVVAFARGLTPRGRALGADAESRPVSYLKEVRPILAQHCFRCHGPDEAARKGKLRLDLKNDAFAARDGKHVIAPGKLDGSLVWHRISTSDEAERRPPGGTRQPQAGKQVA